MIWQFKLSILLLIFVLITIVLATQSAKNDQWKIATAVFGAITFGTGFYLAFTLKNLTKLLGAKDKFVFDLGNYNLSKSNSMNTLI